MTIYIDIADIIWYKSTNMKADLLYSIKYFYPDGSFYEIKIWSVVVVADKPHGFKYSLAYIKDGVRLLGYDNAERKGDHIHLGEKETPYKFKNVDKLLKDFFADMDRIRGVK
jgi:hypothetical protein